MEQELPTNIFFTARWGWHSVENVKLGALFSDLDDLRMEIYPWYIELGKDFTVHIQPNFTTYLDSNASPSLRAQIIRFISILSERSILELRDLPACEGQIFELISPSDHFRGFCTDPHFREYLEGDRHGGGAVYLITRIRTFCDAGLIERMETDTRTSDGANIPLGSIALGVASISDPDTLRLRKSAWAVVQKAKGDWGLTMGGPEPTNFHVYALSYRKIVVTASKGRSETDFIPADNRWKMVTPPAEGETKDSEYIIIEADVESTDRELELCESPETDTENDGSLDVSAQDSQSSELRCPCWEDWAYRQWYREGSPVWSLESS